ncbi:MAG: class I SAM-dependent methyltransferase [Desulfuromonadales bacterium]
MNEEIRGWRFLEIHESSPGGISSDFIREKARDYLPTQYYPEVSTGSIFNGTRCENLEKMTFDDNCFDLIITQDVLEHVLSPEKAFSEIARTLKVGGTHLFTVPFYKGRKTRIRARQKSAGIEYLEEPDYHVNPINSEGALVIREWGDDLFDFIEETSGLQTEIFSFSDKEYGLEGEFLDVFVSRKIR